MDTWRLQTDVGGDLAGRVHLCHAGGQQQTLGGEFFAPARLGGEIPILLASRIGIVTAGRKRRLDGDRAISAERSDHIADHLGAAEQSGQRLDVMLDPGNYVSDITLSGYAPIHKIVTVDKGGKAVVDETLQSQ